MFLKRDWEMLWDWLTYLVENNSGSSADFAVRKTSLAQYLRRRRRLAWFFWSGLEIGVQMLSLNHGWISVRKLCICG